MHTIQRIETTTGQGAPIRTRFTARTRQQTEERHHEQVEAARTLVESRFREPLRLGEIAEAVGSSPFHFARVFKQKTGLPVHRYLQKTRLRVALEEVMSGSSSLTTLAFDLGFSSQSHFTSTFSREFGVPPSRVRDAVREGRLGSFPPL